MKINIASFGGRSHLLDTARELEKFGHEVRFYSYLPTKRALKFGLKKECNYSYFFLALPFLVLFKLTGRANWVTLLFHYSFDYLTAWLMKPCDIFIGQSPMHVYSLKYAKKKFRACIILERGTRHVNEQIKALASNPALNGSPPTPEFFKKRDLKGYDLADYVSVPSEIVKKSFLANNITEDKVFRNPYGVNLKEFKPTVFQPQNSYDLIMVGQWCYRKGCDLLIEVCKKENFSLLHVGAIVDIPFPSQDVRFTHIDSVEQQELINYYSKAKVFVLPSREEGLALVQPQALVCGLPLICSQYTGGRDLKDFLDDPRWIIEMEEYTLEELSNSIKKGLALADKQIGLRSHINDLSGLSWVSYGRRYNDFLNKIKK